MVRPVRMPLDKLVQIPTTDLREEWLRHHGAPAPNLSAEFLRLGIAYRLQEKRHGGISRETKWILLQTSRLATEGSDRSAAPPRKVTPGTRLVRDWHGTGYTVTVLEKGFAFDGRTWRSLTAIAKAITGTHRNGPRFFGLT